MSESARKSEFLNDKRPSKLAPFLALLLAGAGCSAMNKEMENETTLSINGYTINESNPPLGDDPNITVHAVIDGKDVQLSCPVRERCRSIFSLPPESQDRLNSRLFGCVDWETGCSGAKEQVK